MVRTQLDDRKYQSEHDLVLKYFKRVRFKKNVLKKTKSAHKKCKVTNSLIHNYLFFILISRFKQLAKPDYLS